MASAGGEGAVLVPLARRCGGCDGREEAVVEAMLQWQKVSDLLIAASLLSIPLELLYFATCAALAPLRRVLLQLGTFIVMCGVTHLLNVLAYDHPGSHRILVALTTAKILGALATSAAAVSLPVLFPRLLRLKVRESFLRTKARQLDRDLATVRHREETVWRVVRAVTHHIRDSIDARTILRTTMLQLAAALGLSNCAIWMPQPGGSDRGVLQLMDQLLPDRDDEGDKVLHHSGGTRAISVRDPDVAAVLASKDAKVLSRPGSALKAASCRSVPLAGAAAAIRIPNFHGEVGSRNTSEPLSYAILVLVLRAHEDQHRAPTGWSNLDLEIVQAVADQVTVALSHAAALEESQLIRHRLAEQHGALLRARSELAAATKARNNAHSAMRSAMGRPMHSVVGLISVMQQEAAAMRPEQRLIVDAIARTNAVSSTLMDDVMETLQRMVDIRDPPLSTPTPTLVSRRPFELRSLIRDAAFVARCLSGCQELGFSHQLQANSLPEWVVGDDKRVFHLVLHMVGAQLSRCHGQHVTAAGRTLSFSVCSCNSIASEHQDWIPSPLRPVSFTSGNQVFVRIQIGLTKSDPGSSPASRPPQCGLSSDSGGANMRLTFAMCKKIVEVQLFCHRRAQL
jgi:ethylene receptor